MSEENDGGMTVETEPSIDILIFNRSSDPIINNPATFYASYYMDKENKTI